MIKRLVFLLFLAGGLTAGWQARKQYLQHRLLLQKIAGVTASGSSLYFIHQDQLGSTSLITDASGAAVARQTYYPYGTTRATEGSLPTEKQYTGQVSDTDETGLYYYNARYYNPAIAKFTQADSANDGLNRYAYVGNNPINSTDPSGHLCEHSTSLPGDPLYPWELFCPNVIRNWANETWNKIEQVALAFGNDPEGFTDNVFMGMLQAVPAAGAYYGALYVSGGNVGFAEAVDATFCGIMGGQRIDCTLAIQLPGPNMASLKNSIISDIKEGGTNVTTRLANPVIDQMIAAGSNEMDAIALVGNGLIPPYSLDSALLGQANLARSADELMGCPAAICRHNQMITRDIAASRGFDPYLGWLKGEQNGLPWSHGVTVLYDQAGALSVIDPTNFNRAFGLSDYLTALNNQGIGIDSFTASSFSNWSIENRLIPE